MMKMNINQLQMSSKHARLQLVYKSRLKHMMDSLTRRAEDYFNTPAERAAHKDADNKRASQADGFARLLTEEPKNNEGHCDMLSILRGAVGSSLGLRVTL